MRNRMLLWCCICCLGWLVACGRNSDPLLSPTTLISQASPSAQPMAPTPTTAPNTPIPTTPTESLTPAPVPSFTLTPTAEPTTTPITTATTEPTATATPRLMPTPVPLAANAISPVNAAHVIEREHLGWGQVDRVRFSPDGQILAVASTIGIYLHDTNSNLRLFVIPVTSPIRAFNFSPNGQLMATGHDDRRVRLWRVSDGALIRTLEGGHNGAVWSVAFSPDGTLLATTAAAEDGTINVWLVSDGALLRQITGHVSRVRDVVFSPDGQQLASASIDWTVRLWNVADGTQRQRLTGHQGPVWRLVFSADGEYLHTGGSFGELITWRVSDGIQLYQTQTHSQFIEVVALAAWPGDNRLATGAEDGDIFVWELDGGLKQVDYLGTNLVIDDVAVSPDGEYVAAASGHGQVTIYKLPFSSLHTDAIPYDVGTVSQLAFAPDGQSLVINSIYQHYQVEMNHPTFLTPLTLNDLEIRTVAFAPDDNTLFLGTYGKGITLANGTTYELGDSFADGNDTALALSPSQNGNYLAVAWDNSVVSLYDRHGQQGLLTPAVQSWPNSNFYRVYQLAFGANDTVLMWAINDQLRRVDLTTMSLLPPVNDHTGRIARLVTSPAGSQWAMAAMSTVWLYGDAAAANPFRLTGHESTVYALAFSPDGQILASADGRGSIRLWRVSDGHLLKILSSSNDAITSLAFSPDGAWLLSAGTGRVVRFWGLPAEE